MRSFLLLGFLLSIPALLCHPTPDFWSDTPADTLSETLAAGMSDSELVGQLLLLGYMGTDPSPEFLEWIGTYGIGGIKIFGWNAESLYGLAAAISTMQRRSQTTRLKIPLLVATDQEGGWVRHVKAETSITPGNLALGASGIPEDSYRTGYYIGMELRHLGINMNFAPTVDVYISHKADVVGPRAFSSDPVLTSVLAVAYFRGMREAGIICTAKHFPGHGRADEDSHGTLPLVDVTVDELWETDLLPYRFLIREGLPAVMSGHIGFPRIVADETPSSLCPNFQTELLRGRIGFGGIVVTDDLQMTGAQTNGGRISIIARKALEAGNDMIMISRTPEHYEMVRNELLSACRTVPGFRERLRQSAARILRVKLEYLKGPEAVPLYPQPAAVAALIPEEGAGDFFFQTACRSVTLLEDRNIPVRNPGRVLLAGQFQTFFQEGRRIFPGAAEFSFPYAPFGEPDPDVADSLGRIAGSYDTIVFCLANPNSLGVLRSLSAYADRIVVLSVLTPIYLRELPWVGSAVAVYGTGRDSFRAGFSVLAGEFAPEGVLPIGQGVR